MHLNFEIAPEWYDLIYGKAIFPDLDNLRYDIKDLLQQYKEGQIAQKFLKQKAIAFKK